jgi:membrane-bound lytic murein transglycosylase MltF
MVIGGSPVGSHRTCESDFDQTVARRLIRVGITYNRTFYFVDKGVQRGAAYEFAKAFEDWINEKLKTGNTKINVVLMPMARDVLLPAVIHGKVDFEMAQITASDVNTDLSIQGACSDS